MSYVKVTNKSKGTEDFDFSTFFDLEVGDPHRRSLYPGESIEVPDKDIVNLPDPEDPTFSYEIVKEALTDELLLKAESNPNITLL